MKTVFKIAKAELRSLFYSPIAWFLMIVFLIQCGIVYLGQLDSAARQQELGGMGIMYMDTLTSRVFLSPRGVFGSVMQNLYLFIPLLTMSLISRETSSGTIKLLYSSPIKVWEIVFGKYLSMMIYSLVLVAIVGIFVVSGLFHIRNPETGMLMTAMLGFYLLLCAYSAIGLFMSCLTTYQVVAAICTFVMIGILSFIGTLWQRVEFVRELTYFLSINGRTQKMLGGLVTTKDVIYFIVIVYIFLGLSVYKLRDGMESRPAMVKMGRYAAIIVSALLVGYFSSLPGMIGYYDATANKSRTLTPKAQQIIKELGEEPLEIISYNNLLGSYWFLGGPESYNQHLARWEPYMRFKHNIQLKTISYYDSAFDNPYLFRSYPDKNLKQIAEQYAKNNDIKLKSILTPEEIRKMINLKPEQNRFVMQLKWKNRTTFLRVFNDQMMWPGETEVSAAFKRLQQAKLPKIVFLTGDLERDINKIGDRDYKTLTNQATFRNSLVNQGFDVDTLSLDTRDIPAGVAALVIADPKIAFTPVTFARLQRYINEGGNLLVAGEPGKQSVLNPLLKELGVELMNGTLIQESKDLAPNLVAPDLTQLAATFSKPLAQKAADSAKISMPGTAGLSYTNGGAFNIQPLLLTDAKLTWNRVKPLDLDMMTSANAGSQGVTTMGGGMATVTRPAAPETSASGKVERTQPNASRTGNSTAVMTTEMKKSRDSIRAALTAIMNGAGTQEEKQKKAVELMARASRMQPAMQGKALVKKTTPATDNTDAPAASGGIVMAMPAGGSGSMGDGRRSAAAGTVRFSAAEGDVKGPIPTALSLTRKVNGKEQRIIVTGDADFMSNAELQRFNLKTANFIFNTALFSWLSYGEFPIDTSRPEAKDKRVNVTMDQVDFLRIIYVWILPALLLAFAAILLIRRKRK